MKSRISLRTISFLLLTLFGGLSAFSQEAAGKAAVQEPFKPLVHLPQLHDTVAAPAKVQTPWLAKPLVQPLTVPMIPTPSAVTTNPVSLNVAPFAHNYSTGGLYGDYGVFAVVYGDFRHAGTTDAVGLSVDGILTVMANDGKGNFTKVSSNLSQTATFVNVGLAFAVDLDGDGWLDVVALDSYHAGYIVWKNVGGGKFADAVRTDLAVSTPAGFSVQANGMAVGDMDGDGRSDLAVAYTVADPATTNVQLVLAGLKGNGDGTFQAPVTNAGLSLSYQAYFGQIDLADMRNSGTLDIVANINIFGSNAFGSGYATYSVAPGTGSVRPGELSLPPQGQWVIGSVGRGGSFVVRDVDGDGNRDVFASPGLYNVYLAKGDGKGNLTKPQSVIQTDTISVGTTLGDFNRDGYLDAAVFSDGLINIFNGLGGGAFSPTFVHQYPGSYASRPLEAAIDLNGDTVPDFTEPDGLFNYLVSFVNDGTGNFTSATAVRSSNTGTDLPTSLKSSIYYTVLEEGDFNGDGLTDVLAQEGNSYVDIGLNDGKGGFKFTRAISAATAATLHLNVLEPIQVDLNHDGFQDLVFTSKFGIAIGLSDGKGGIRKWVTSSLPISPGCDPSLGAAGDLDGDGKIDLVLPYAGDSFCGVSPSVTDSGYFIAKGNGDGSFTTTFTPGGTSYYSAHLADMNHDGKLDLLLNDVGYNSWNMSVIAGNGTVAPVAQPIQLYSPGSPVYDFTVDDFNGDGNLDLILSQRGAYGATDSTRAGVVMLAGKGDLTVDPIPTFLVDGGYATSLTDADMNHDGRTDVLAVLYPASDLLNGLAIIRSNGDGTFQAPDIYPTPSEEGRHFNSQVYTGAFQASNSTDILMGGGNEYVPSVLIQNSATTSLQLSVNRASAMLGDSVALYAQLAGLPQSKDATGTVSFLANGKAIGSGSLQAGLASLTVTTLPAGIDTLTASYAGDATHAAAVSKPVAVTVQAPTPDFSLTADGTMLSLVNGSTARTNIGIATNASLNGTLTLTCIGLPITVQCAFSPATSSLGSSQQSTIRLDVTPTNNASLTQPLSFGKFPPTVAGLFTLVGAVGLRRRKRVAALCCVAFIALTGLSGCSGDGKQVQTVYFSVVAQVASGNTTVSHSTPMQVVVRQ